MTKVKHPSDRRSRRLAREKYDEQKKNKEARASKVWLKRTKEYLKAEETEDELRAIEVTEG